MHAHTPKGKILERRSSRPRGVIVPAKAAVIDFPKEASAPKRSISQYLFIGFPVGILAIICGVSFYLLKDTGLRAPKKNHGVYTVDSWSSMIASDIADNSVTEYYTLSRPALKRKPRRQIPVVMTASMVSPKEQSFPALVTQVFDIIRTNSRKRFEAKRLAQSIVSECLKVKYDPLFVAAVIKSESAFNELAVSNKGAQGLMQIMPATGKYLSKFADESKFPVPIRLTDPGYNIHLGVTYLRQLEEMYDGNRLLTLIAYNWGPGKLDRAIRSGKGVPAECLRYALKILRDHKVWETDPSFS